VRKIVKSNMKIYSCVAKGGNKNLISLHHLGNEIETADTYMLDRTMRRMLVTCAGVLVADIFAADLPKVSGPGELTIAPKGIEMHTGGHSANVSINLREMGVSEGEVSSVGAIGEDLFGDFIEGVLKSQGVVAHLQRIQEAGTSKNLILVVTGEDRRFHVDVGANWHLSPEHVQSVLAEEKPFIFYVGATGILGKFDEKLHHILQTAKGYSCLTFVDPVVPYKRGWDFLFHALKWVDIFHCNNFEASSMTGEKDPRKAAEALNKEGVRLAIITMGGQGLIAKTEENTLEMPALKVPLIDPSGAGDAFCSGMIYKLVQKTCSRPRDISKLSAEDLSDILLEGAAAGASCVTAVGTRTAVTRENVNRLLKEQGQKILEKTSKTAERRAQ